MQKLKKLPLLTQLGNTTKSLLGSVNKLLAHLPRLPDPLTMVAWIVGLILLLSLLLSLTACSPRTVRPNLPPQADARPIPEFEGRTYRDALLYLVEVRESALSCEADKAAIRQVYGSKP